MNARDRFLATMRFQPSRPRPLWEWHYLEDTIARWHSEGLPQEVYLPADSAARVSPGPAGSTGQGTPICDYFGLDRGRPYCQGTLAYVPVNNGLLPPFQVQVLAEDETTRTLIDDEGVKKQVLKGVVLAMPRFLEFPVKSRTDFQRIQARYDPASPGRYPDQAEWKAFKANTATRDYPLGLIFDGFFGRFRRWMGLEALSSTLHDDPSLFEAMCVFTPSSLSRPSSARSERCRSTMSTFGWRRINVNPESQIVRYIGSESANTDYHDGQLRPAVGVHSCQVMRANRTHPEQSDGFGWTQNHAPMLAFWHDRFYLEYLSTPMGEHVPPGHTLLTTSEDGLHWEKPVVVFPVIDLPQGIYQGYPLPPDSQGIMHQRMGFYVAPDGRLLVLGFYACAPTTLDGVNNGTGLGRVVRQVHTDGTFGPIYFLRYNRHAGWDETNTPFPFYRASGDAGFVAACDALLANKLMTQQWWEEDRSPDGFYAVEGYKALSFYHLPNSRVVGLWKFSKAAISEDEGQTWSEVYDVPSLVMSGAKVWGQRTSDGRYALVYNPSPDGEHRWPLAMVTGEDGISFDDLLCVCGEVPPRRYVGTHKDFGQNYVRGIAEGNGSPPDGGLWVAFSMTKEDIWVSRVPVPVKYRVEEPVEDTFNDMRPGSFVRDWNIYSPRWAPVSVIDFPSAKDKSLELRDYEPYDYAKAERVFPESTKVTVEFKLSARHTGVGQLQFEVVDRRGGLAVRLVFDADGVVKLKGAGHQSGVAAFHRCTWHKVRMTIDTEVHRFDLALDDRTLVRGGALAMPLRSVERLVFRTGPRRREPTLDTNRFEGEDLPHADEPTMPAVFCINYVRTSDHMAP